MSKKKKTTGDVEQPVSASRISLRNVLDNGAIQDYLYGIHYDKLGNAAHGYGYPPMSNAELAIGVCIRNIIASDELRYNNDKNVLLGIAMSSKRLRKVLAKQIFEHFEKTEDIHTKWKLIQLAIEIRHNKLCKMMIEYDQTMINLVIGRFECVVSTISVELFRYMVQTYLMQDLEEYVEDMARLTDSETNRKKLHIFFDACETKCRRRKTHWTQHKIFDRNFLGIVVQQDYLNIAIFRELSEYYSSDFAELYNSGSNDTQKTPLTWMIQHLAWYEFLDTKTFVFVMSKSDLNMPNPRFTPIQALICDWRGVVEFLDYQMILDYLNSGVVQHDPRSLIDTTSTPLELIALQGGGQVHPFLQGLENWIGA